ncbi:hypothetical protein BJY52DRAFT_130832 [Lactarius psammicola]|nr:hypothetical protein BJY52DRAFT_130832 [Lactarius psammicola]
MGQTSSRHRPDNSLSLNPALSTTHSSSSSTRVADQSSTHSSHHNSDLSNQAPLPSKRSNRRSFLGTLRSPLRHSLNHQQATTPQGDTHRPKAHKRWTLYGRRKPSEPARAPPDQLPGYDEAQLGEPSRARSGPPSSPFPSNSTTATTTTAADPKGKAKEDNPSPSTAELVSTTMPGPSSSGSSTIDASQPTSVPLLGTATDVSSSSASSPPTSRDPVAALNHDPRPLPTISIQPDSTPNWTRDNPEPFDVMERPATPPDPAQAPPPETRRNFPAAGTLVVVQGVVHTSDVSQSNGTEPSDTASHPASPVPPSGERPSRRRFSDLLSRPIRSRRSSYAAPESQSSETSASTESENQEESSATSETSQEQPAQEDPPVPASRPLSLSPTSIDVLGTLLSVATAATAASLVSGSSDPLLTSGLALPGMQGMQPTPSPISDQGHGHSHTHSLSQSSGQGQSRPLSPTPTAGLASRDRVRNAWAGLRDRLGLRPSSPTSAPVPPPVISPSPEPEPALSASSPTTPVDPRTQLLADMARAFQMGMGLDDTPGSGTRSGGAPPPPPASPAIEVSLGDGQQRQQAQQQERPPPPEDSFERFLMDLQVDLRRTLEDGQPEAEPEADREPDRRQDVEPSRVDTPPLVYPQESPLSAADRASANADVDFSEGLPALPPDNDELLSDDDLDADDDETPDENDREPEEETAAPPQPSSSALPSQPESRPAPQASQTPRRTVAGSERRPGGGINWWRMYRFPPMVVPHGSGAPGSAHSPTSPSSPAPATSPSADPTATTTGDASFAERQRNEAAPPTPDLPGAQTQDGNTVVPVIVVGLQSVHGHGHGHGQGHRHAEGRDEHPPLPPPLLPQDQMHNDHEHALQDDVAGDAATESPRDRERERRWSTRAADALRGFRPAPGPGTTRHESSGPGSGGGESGARTGDDGHGSTTFFIYVIGGYYPPNHQLVVGTDPLDSFEELAELLGQVKPPTASKEDIDNSGLEVIRPSVLAEYEKIGRIAPMCVDRCLICLEDYNPNEDLRLLSCRHVFHRDCVDRWLETGRNNCPACRSQGVTTNPGPIPIPSSA